MANLLPPVVLRSEEELLIYAFPSLVNPIIIIALAQLRDCSQTVHVPPVVLARFALGDA